MIRKHPHDRREAVALSPDQELTLAELRELLTQSPSDDVHVPQWVTRSTSPRVQGAGGSIIESWFLELVTSGLQPPVVFKTRTIEIDRDGVVIRDTTEDHPDEI
jgi:hypothetical protein